jgi:hypothetical protein
MSREAVISRAHDVRQDLPLSACRYVCIRCGLRGGLDTLFGPIRCEPHREFASSGWLDEGGKPKGE